MSDTPRPDELEPIEADDGDEPGRRGLTAPKAGIPQPAPGGDPVPPDSGGMTPDKDVIGSG